MKRIIKRGYTFKPYYHAICSKCGCEFECEDSDLINSSYTECPECGNIISESSMTRIIVRDIMED